MMICPINITNGGNAFLHSHLCSHLWALRLLIWKSQKKYLLSLWMQQNYHDVPSAVNYVIDNRMMSISDPSLIFLFPFLPVVFSSQYTKLISSNRLYAGNPACCITRSLLLVSLDCTSALRILTRNSSGFVKSSAMV